MQRARYDHPVDNRPLSAPLPSREVLRPSRLIFALLKATSCYHAILRIVLLRQFISNSRFDPRVHPVVQRIPSAPHVTRKGQWAIDVRVMGYQLTGCNLRSGGFHTVEEEKGASFLSLLARCGALEIRGGFCLFKVCNRNVQLKGKETLFSGAAPGCEPRSRRVRLLVLSSI